MKRFMSMLLSAGIVFGMMSSSVWARASGYFFVNQFLDESGYFKVDKEGNLSDGTENNYNLHVVLEDELIEIKDLDVEVTNAEVLLMTAKRLTLNIVGENSFTNTVDETSGLSAIAGIVAYSDDDMTIQGNGSLNINISASSKCETVDGLRAEISKSQTEQGTLKIIGEASDPLELNINLNGTNELSRAIYGISNLSCVNVEINSDVMSKNDACFVFCENEAEIKNCTLSGVIMNSDANDNNKVIGISTAKSLHLDNVVSDLTVEAKGGYAQAYSGIDISIADSDIDAKCSSGSGYSAGFYVNEDKDITISNTSIDIDSGTYGMLFMPYNVNNEEFVQPTVIFDNCDIDVRTSTTAVNLGVQFVNIELDNTALNIFSSDKPVPSILLFNSIIEMSESSLVVRGNLGIAYSGMTTMEMAHGSDITLLCDTAFVSLFDEINQPLSSLTFKPVGDFADEMKVMTGELDKNEFAQDPDAYIADIYDKVSLTDKLITDLYSENGIVRIDGHECDYGCDSTECKYCESKIESPLGHEDKDGDGRCDGCGNVMSADITIAEPEANQKLPTSVTVDVDSVSGEISWNPSGNNAQYDTEYTATLVLTDNTDNGFDENVVIKINGKEVVATIGSDGKVTVTYKFDKTDSEPTPTNSPSPSPSPSPTPTKSPNPTPTKSPSPTPTKSPNPTPTLPPVVPTPTPELNPGDFISRCYEVALQRDADEAGYDYWVNKLTNGEACGAQVGYGYIFSEEYINRERSDSDYVRDLYRMFFDREPDQGGYDYWVGMLNNGVDREVVFAGFANSEEYYNLCYSYGVVAGVYIVGMDLEAQSGVNCFVARLYKVCLNRLPDMAGQQAWVMQLVNKVLSGSSCAAGFIFSVEFTNLDLDNASYVAYMYRAFFGREADQDGLNYWVGKLDDGKSSREEVFNGFSESTEFANLCASYGINA